MRFKFGKGGNEKSGYQHCVWHQLHLQTHGIITTLQQDNTRPHVAGDIIHFWQLFILYFTAMSRFN